MVIEKKSRVKMSPLDWQRRLLYPLLDYRINMSYAEMNYNVPYIRGLATTAVLTVLAVTATIGSLIRKL